MTNNNLTPDPKDPRNLNNEEVTRRVGDADTTRVEKVTTERTTRDTAGSTAVAENEGSGWWKWLLGLLALLLLGWLLWSLFNNDDEAATTGETSTSVVATETENVTETEAADNTTAGNAAESAANGAGNAAESAANGAGNAAESAGNAAESAVATN
ncbi:hypothetical protein G7Y29_04605 [Corynebacterium qintianiae]|uniref:Uncharacterized protein n=1 Tax=Corynebacterium qintianiae TaxID=2709392 RepID=A0A7T0KPV1_9CORY|nr:hypothetical protein [Corynebacterium qintianiae]QPK84064.1 hypothetical protein G7Y29_04605 [Corynebacterium qintianiae]